MPRCLQPTPSPPSHPHHRRMDYDTLLAVRKRRGEWGDVPHCVSKALLMLNAAVMHLQAEVVQEHDEAGHTVARLIRQCDLALLPEAAEKQKRAKVRRSVSEPAATPTPTPNNKPARRRPKATSPRRAPTIDTTAPPDREASFEHITTSPREDKVATPPSVHTHGTVVHTAYAASAAPTPTSSSDDNGVTVSDVPTITRDMQRAREVLASPSAPAATPAPTPPIPSQDAPRRRMESPSHISTRSTPCPDEEVVFRERPLGPPPLRGGGGPAAAASPPVEVRRRRVPQQSDFHADMPVVVGQPLAEHSSTSEQNREPYGAAASPSTPLRSPASAASRSPSFRRPVSFGGGGAVTPVFSNAVPTRHILEPVPLRPVHRAQGRDEPVTSPNPSPQVHLTQTHPLKEPGVEVAGVSGGGEKVGAKVQGQIMLPE